MLFAYYESTIVNKEFFKPKLKTHFFVLNCHPVSDRLVPTAVHCLALFVLKRRVNINLPTE